MATSNQGSQHKLKVNLRIGRDWVMVMENKKKIHHAWWILVSCCALVTTGVGIYNNCAGLFFAPVCKELHFSRSALSAYISILLLVSIAAMPIAGRMYHRGHIKLILATSVIALAGGFIIMARGTSLTYWYVAGVIQGIAGGFFSYLPVPILIGNWFRHRTGLALGVALAFSGVGGAVFNPIVQSFITFYGWRMGYMAMAAMGLVLFLPFVFLIHFKPSDIGLNPYGADRSNNGVVVRELIGCGAHKAFRSPSYYLALFACALFGLSTVFSFHIPGYVVSLGYPPMMGATVASAAMIGIILGKLGIGGVNDKFGLKVSSVMGVTVGVVSMALLFAGRINIFVLFAGSLCFGFGCVGSAVILTPLVLKSIFGNKDFGPIFANVAMAQALASAAGIALFGWVFDKTKSFSMALLIVGVVSLLCLPAIFAAIRFGRGLNGEDGSSSMPGVEDKQRVTV